MHGTRDDDRTAAGPGRTDGPPVTAGASPTDDLPTGGTVPPPRTRADRVGLVLAWGAVGAVGLVALLSTAPALVGLSMVTPWAQLVLLRAATGAGALVLAVLLGLLALAVRVHRRARASRRWPVMPLVLAAALAVTAAGHGGVLLVRSPAPLAAAPGAPLPAARAGDLVVTALNVGPTGTPATDVADLVVRRGSDVLALSETPTDLAREVADALAERGRPVQLLSAADLQETPLVLPSPGALVRDGLLLPLVRPSTHLLVSEDLGPYAQRPAPPLRGGAVVAVPVDAAAAGAGPPLAAVHTLPAVPLLFDMGLWRAETEAAAGLCATLAGGVVAGDLNATSDHAVLRGSACADGTGDGSVGAPAGGTWPSDLPVALGAGIDHVLPDERTWRSAAAALDEVGSDHRALTVLLRPLG